MTSRLSDYIDAGKALDADERLEAAHQLLLSVDEDTSAQPDEIDAAWNDAIHRRVDEIVSGEAKLSDGRVGLDRIRDDLAARRS